MTQLVDADTAGQIGAWLIHGQTGISSRFIAAVMLGADPVVDRPYWGHTHPIDPADFGRCYKLIEAAPGIQGHLDVLREADATWNAMVDEWQTMTDLYERDRESGKSTELYNLMKKLAE